MTGAQIRNFDSGGATGPSMNSKEAPKSALKESRVRSSGKSRGVQIFSTILRLKLSVSAEFLLVVWINSHRKHLWYSFSPY